MISLEEGSENLGTTPKRLTLLAPRRPSYNQSLMVQIENKRYQLPNFSDAHWLMQLLVEYTFLFDGDHSGKDLTPQGAMCAAAIEDVFETLLKSGDKAAIARATALKEDGFPIITWFPVSDNGDWDKIRDQALKEGVYHYKVSGD